jgi:hypothetical protein
MRRDAAISLLDRVHKLHQPLGPVDDHGHPILEYQGAAVPKRMNKLGSAGAPGAGSFLTADPVSEHEGLTEAAHAAERKALTALREHQERDGSSNGQTKPTAKSGVGPQPCWRPPADSGMHFRFWPAFIGCRGIS